MRKGLIIKFNKVLPAFSLFFLFSLFVHNHTVSFINQNGQALTKYHNSKVNYSSEFCSACRIGGKIQKNDYILSLNNISFKSNIVSYKIILEDYELIYHLSPRSPPLNLS
jgi:hypothetical protein